MNDSPEPALNNPRGDLQVFSLANLLRMVFVLTVVVAVIYALYYFLRNRKKPYGGESSFITLLSSQSLPGGKMLYIIDVAGRIYLLGAGESTVSLIAEIEDKPTIDALRLQSEQQELQPHSFGQLMNTIFIKGKDAPSHPFNFLHQQRKNLRRL